MGVLRSDATTSVAACPSDGSTLRTGEVVKLDRGYPLVRFPDGETLRCEHATALVKGQNVRAVIGDEVEVSVPASHDKGVIEAIAPRTREFVRKDPTERALPQVLAANFERVIVAQPLAEVNLRRLERELVLAFETGAQVTVVLTKADLADDETATDAVVERVRALAGPDTEVLVVSECDPASVEAVRDLLAPGTTTVLIGRSGVGKSSLINMLVGSELLDVGAVRAADGKGRHTTVSREIVQVPGAGRIVDMPGVRGLGLWDADSGIEAAFPDVAALAEQCRFRDCSHRGEPGCAVCAAVDAGELPQQRLDSYLALKQEMATVKDRREQARRMGKEQASSPRQKRKGGTAAKKGASRKKRR